MSRLSVLTDTDDANKAFAENDFPMVTTAIYNFWLYELCDVYVVSATCVPPLCLYSIAHYLHISVFLCPPFAHVCIPVPTLCTCLYSFIYPFYMPLSTYYSSLLLPQILCPVSLPLRNASNLSCKALMKKPKMWHVPGRGAMGPQSFHTLHYREADPEVSQNVTRCPSFHLCDPIPQECTYILCVAVGVMLVVWPSI